MVIIKNSEVNSRLDFDKLDVVVDWVMIALFVTLVIWFITLLVRK